MPVKPSEREDEYFARLECERRKHALATQSAEAVEERQQQEWAAAFRCPKCGAVLVAVPYKGIEVDTCSHCQGLWLDCGELAKVLEGDQGFLGTLKRIFA